MTRSQVQVLDRPPRGLGKIEVYVSIFDIVVKS
jgi:hypothetical protein